MAIYCTESSCQAEADPRFGYLCARHNAERVQREVERERALRIKVDAAEIYKSLAVQVLLQNRSWLDPAALRNLLSKAYTEARIAAAVLYDNGSSREES